MGFSETIKFCYTNYANFNGRGSIPEFWFWALYNILVGLGGYTFVSVVTNQEIAILLIMIFSISSLIPNIARGVRRLHDIGKPGSYPLFALILVVGNILLTLWFCTKGKPEANRFGPAPPKIRKLKGRGILDIVSGE